MDGPGDDHTKRSQRKTNIYHLYVESKKIDINELTYKTEIDSGIENKVYPTARELGQGDKLEFGI